MQPAADVMQKALAEVAVKAPSVRFVANVVAGEVSDPQEIKRRLVEQVCGVVRWRECVQYMAGQGANVMYEVGAGRVLTGIARRFDGIEAKSVGTPEELEAAASTLAA
jgi:[acyl-carrier-protein] S-malonyltransferase